MKKYTYILFSLVLLISSCRECKDCIMILEMDAGITNAMLDSIAQTVNNDYVYTGTYLSWEEYVSFNYSPLLQENQHCDDEYVEDWEEICWLDNFRVGELYYDCK